MLFFQLILCELRVVNRKLHMQLMQYQNQFDTNKWYNNDKLTSDELFFKLSL